MMAALCANLRENVYKYDVETVVVEFSGNVRYLIESSTISEKEICYDIYVSPQNATPPHSIWPLHPTLFYMRSRSVQIPLQMCMAMISGAFVGRRSDGHHNGVSRDMFLEQTYNADAKANS